MPEEVHGPVTPASPDAAPLPQPAIPMLPAPTREVRAMHVKWSNSGITTCFDERFAQATRSCEGRDITMIFEEWAQLGCLTTIPLEFSAAVDLVWALTGVVLHWMDDGQPLPDIEGPVVTMSEGTTLWRVVSRERITNALGPTVLAHVNDARNELNGGVRMSISRHTCSLSFTTSITVGTYIRDCLRSSM